MKLFDWVLGKKHPSAAWHREPGFVVQLDLDRHALCRCRIGDPLEWISGLGPPEDSRALSEQRYCYYSQGIEIGEEDNKMADFAVFWFDYLQAGFQPFKGPVTYGGKTVSLGSGTTETEFVHVCGAPYWRDQDQDEIILFYEFRGDIEWQVEFTLKSELKALRVVWPAIMGDAEQRERYGVTQPWPPREGPSHDPE